MLHPRGMLRSGLQNAAPVLHRVSDVMPARPVAPLHAGAAASTSGSAGQHELPESFRDFRPNVGVCVFNGSGQVFAATRTDDTANTWQMPQGGIDPGEDAEAAALRELYEETSIRSVRVVGCIPRWMVYEFPTEVRCKLTGSWKDYRGQAQKWFLLQFYGDDTEINLDTSHKEFSKWKWMDLTMLPDAVISFKRSVYEEVVQEFQPRITHMVKSTFEPNNGDAHGA